MDENYVDICKNPRRFQGNRRWFFFLLARLRANCYSRQEKKPIKNVVKYLKVSHMTVRTKSGQLKYFRLFQVYVGYLTVKNKNKKVMKISMRFKEESIQCLIHTVSFR